MCHSDAAEPIYYSCSSSSRMKDFSSTQWTADVLVNTTTAATLHMPCVFNTSEIATGATSSDIFCPTVSDGVSCWPTTIAGTTAVIACFSEFNDVKYDSSANVTRRCFPNATWEYTSDYSNCKALIESQETFDDEWNSTEMVVIVYYIGFSISLACLLVALAIFIKFKDLRCIRNTFHANLMLTYVLVDLMWIITASNHTTAVEERSVMCVLVIFLYYFKGTNFFWMFVEGFYLYMLVVNTFSVEKVRFGVYFFIGWGAPAVVVVAWASMKSQLIGSNVTRSLTKHGPNGELSVGCPWIEEHDYDWIFIAPILIVLMVNMIFLIRIMWVLITKLRASTSAESQQYRPMLLSSSSNQDCFRTDKAPWKAAKALLILIPLLGVTYILVIAAPKKGISSIIIAYIRSVLISTQGMTVSILYCFLNGEVRNVLRHHWQRRFDRRSLGASRHSSLRCFGQGSFKSRTESVRLQARCNDKGRESCTSCATSTSYVGNDGVPTVIVQMSPCPSVNKISPK